MPPASPAWVAAAQRLSGGLLLAFGALLLAVLVPHLRLFAGRRGRAHRLLGAAHLLWLALGVGLALDGDGELRRPALQLFAYDVSLAVLGTALTLTAAAAFGKRRVRNRASGALDEDATVTGGARSRAHTPPAHVAAAAAGPAGSPPPRRGVSDEMMEHAFYQALNGVQIVYLHAVSRLDSRALRVTACLAATVPWLLRGLFPGALALR